MHYTFDAFGRYAGTSPTPTARSTPTAPPELTPEWNWNDVAWVHAPGVVGAVAPTASINTPRMPVLSTTAFKMCFTAAESIAIYAARAENSTINYVLTLLDDPKTTEVDLNLQTNQDYISYLASQGLLSEERVPAVRAGKIL